MPFIDHSLVSEIRERFCNVDKCPISGERIFFENAGGALTLRSALETSTKFAAIPDNQGRDNFASHTLNNTIKNAKSDLRILFNAQSGEFFMGESGTELLFRLIRNAVTASPPGGSIVGTSLEHPASRSAAKKWSEEMKYTYVSVPHDIEKGIVEAANYADRISDTTRVVTIVHASPVTGMGTKISEISRIVRKKAPSAFIIVDGIQHAAHGGIDVESYDIDGYVISPYKMFSRHGFGIAWVSDRLRNSPHEKLDDGPSDNWELGTRDTGAYATMSDVKEYMCWLGKEFTTEEDSRAQIEAAGAAIQDYEKKLTNAILYGVDNLKGLTDFEEVEIIGGANNPSREGLVSFRIKKCPSEEIVTYLNQQGIRTHTRKCDHYSGNILAPLGWDDCVRVSICHYNTQNEVKKFLSSMAAFADK